MPQQHHKYRLDFLYWQHVHNLRIIVVTKQLIKLNVPVEHVSVDNSVRKNDEYMVSVCFTVHSPATELTSALCTLA